jgi:hypothetical protein
LYDISLKKDSESAFFAALLSFGQITITITKPIKEGLNAGTAPALLCLQQQVVLLFHLIPFPFEHSEQELTAPFSLEKNILDEVSFLSESYAFH